MVQRLVLSLILGSALALGISPAVWASSAEASHTLGATASALGFAAIAAFAIAYIFAMIEEFTHLRKSKPIILAAGLIWVFVAILNIQHGGSYEQLHAALNHNLLEYGALFLFLLVAMTYINFMTDRGVFDALRAWLIRRNFSYRKLFWMTGFLAFFISPIADNLTTALLMGAVILAVGGHDSRFVGIAFINVVIGANAGGAFSPFGDITTLMVWQAGKANFFQFFELFLPAVTNFVVPAAIMQFAVSTEIPKAPEGEQNSELRRGAITVCLMFLGTIATAVCFKQFLHLPPYLGMMTGFSVLMIYSYYLKKTGEQDHEGNHLDIFSKVEQAEWDTLFFFFGVVFCVGGLGYIGYLEMASVAMYGGLGATTANVLVGIMSAVVDNIPVMFAVLTMNPEMDMHQWMLITLTAGVGGSLLSVGSAAGVALMGQSRGMYTFFGHLKWAPVVALGYAASIGVHLLVNGQ